MDQILMTFWCRLTLNIAFERGLKRLVTTKSSPHPATPFQALYSHPSLIKLYIILYDTYNKIKLQTKLKWLGCLHFTSPYLNVFLFDKKPTGLYKIKYIQLKVQQHYFLNLNYHVSTTVITSNNYSIFKNFLIR